MKRRRSLVKRELINNNVIPDNKGKKIIKTQSDIENELNIRSYSEYKIKDDDSLFKYDNEDIETKMIRLVIIKKKGGNVLENININTKNELSSKLPKIKQALSILENMEIHRKYRKFLKKLKIKKISAYTKRNILILIFKIKKYILKLYLKKYYNILMQYCISHINYKEILNKSKNIEITSSKRSKKK